jgi:hypothetical protein
MANGFDAAHRYGKNEGLSMSIPQVEATAKPAQAKRSEKENQAANGIENLDAKRAEIEARIAELQQMEGMPIDLVRKAREAFDARRAEIDGLGNQLAEIEALTGARVKEQREEAEVQRQQQLAEMRKRLVALAEDRLKAIADAEAGARQLAASLTSVLRPQACHPARTRQATDEGRHGGGN